MHSTDEFLTAEVSKIDIHQLFGRSNQERGDMRHDKCEHNFNEKTWRLLGSHVHEERKNTETTQIEYEGMVWTHVAQDRVL